MLFYKFAIPWGNSLKIQAHVTLPGRIKPTVLHGLRKRRFRSRSITLDGNCLAQASVSRCSGSQVGGRGQDLDIGTEEREDGRIW